MGSGGATLQDKRVRLYSGHASPSPNSFVPCSWARCSSDGCVLIRFRSPADPFGFAMIVQVSLSYFRFLPDSSCLIPKLFFSHFKNTISRLRPSSVRSPNVGNIYFKNTISRLRLFIVYYFILAFAIFQKYYIKIETLHNPAFGSVGNVFQKYYIKIETARRISSAGTLIHFKNTISRLRQ